MREMKRSEKEMDKASRENEESKRRAVIMVVCNSTLNFCLKIPILIPALNDFRILVNAFSLPYRFQQIPNFLILFDSPLKFKYYCVTEKSCQIFQAFGNCLFLVSLSTILFFLKHFDMNFKCAFKRVFANRKNNKNSIVFLLSRFNRIFKTDSPWENFNATNIFFYVYLLIIFF